jgi:hypothetical protein
VAFTPDTSNTMFNLAVDLVNQSCRNIFLTGKAGTGKTTFLKYIRENCLKQIAVVAPTGVAAINAGGVTIHSFFQLPFSPFIPESKGFGMNNEVADRHDLLSRMKLTKEKRKTIQELELLIIDEISMVRCDTLDAIDTVLRQIRQRRFEQFGGVQVLFVGDMFQLPPVVAGSEWQILSEYYDSPYFFDSRVITEKAPVHVEFTKIYRQSEERLISLLNQIRNNELTEEGNETLGSRFIPRFNAAKDEGYILLTTHNRKADAINIEELQKINAKQYEFMAVIEGEFPEKACPAEMGLTLKVGAQVMFLKNDTLDRGRRYFNGKIGVVTRIEDEKVFVQCQDEPFEIDVVKETWKNIRYTLNKNSRKLDEEVLGSFIQYPLRLAWAITIHKSQGLTFEKAIIDAEEAFAPGQVYVALSRCTCLSGMILESKIHPRCLHIDKRIVAFSKSNSSHVGLLAELAVAKKDYQSILLYSLFNFSISVQYCKEIFEYVAEHGSSFNVETLGWLESLYQNIQDIQEVAIKFQSRLKVLFVDEDADGLNVQQRITAASIYFTKRLDEVLDYLQKSPAVTDSRLHAKEYNDALREIFAQFAFKKHLLRGFEQGFSLENYQQQKQKFLLPSCSINAYAPASRELVDSPHPALHQQLRRLRDSICAKKDLPVYYVVTGRTLDELACYLPQTLDELEKISGFGKAKIENYGSQFLDIITKYSLEQGLSSQIHNKSPKRQRKAGNNTLVKKSDTRAASFELFKKGMSVAHIAKQRGFAIQTIEGHLAYYVSQGAINIKELVGTEKLLLIEEALKDYTDNAIAPIKAKLSSSISFGEIRLVIAWHRFQNNNQ